ncbi:MAG: GyrI-like domain-containing protein [Cyanobacteria bacterium P01_G01_bin.49]
MKNNQKTFLKNPFFSALFVLAIFASLFSGYRTISAKPNDLMEARSNANKQSDTKTTPEYVIKETEPIYIVGISLETSLKDEQYTQDLQNLWDKYAQEDPLAKVSNKLDDKIYVAYTNYGSGDGYGFTFVMGHRVANLDTVPADLDSLTIPASKYAVFKVSGDLEQNVTQLWEEVEEIDLKRAYSTDLEVYENSPISETEGEMEIWASVQ